MGAARLRDAVGLSEGGGVMEAAFSLVCRSSQLDTSCNLQPAVCCDLRYRQQQPPLCLPSIHSTCITTM